MMSVYKTIHHCLDKPAYSSHGEAVRAMYRAVLRKNCINPRIHPYECAFAPHFHLGKTRQERQERKAA
jgi:hypothetical protein